MRAGGKPMHPELSAEQSYFDQALTQREQYRERKRRSAEAGGDPRAAAALKREFEAMEIADPDEQVAWGRVDIGHDHLYVGKDSIWDASNDVIVINYRADAAQPFYLATPQEPLGVDLRRLYRCEKNTILDIEDEALIAREAAFDEEPRYSDA